MKPRTLLILLAVVLGLGAFIWFYERELPSSEEREKLEKKVVNVEKDEVTAVTVEASRGRVRLERIGTPKPAKEEDGEETPQSAAEWKLVEPFNTRADAFAVDRLLDSVISLERTRTLENVNRKDVGLDKPRATVRLKTKDGEKVLQIGASVPTGGSLIAGLKGEKEAYVVPDSILTEFDRDPGDWRDRLMFRGERDAIQRITLKGAGTGPVVLAQRPDGFWIEQPPAVKDRADREAVDGLLSDLSGLTAEQFADGPQPLAEMGLAPPREVIEVTLKGQPKPERIDLGAPVTGEAAPEGQAAGELTWAKASNTVFQVRTRLAESVRRAPADWRAKQLSALEVHEVESATVADGKTSFQLTRSDTDWKRGDTLISFLPVSDLLSAVTGARADRLLAPQESQALKAKPLFTFTLKSKETGEETLTVYPPLPEGVPARSSGRPTVLLLPKSTLQEIQKKVAEVRGAKAVEAAK